MELQLPVSQSGKVHDPGFCTDASDCHVVHVSVHTGLVSEYK